MPQATVTGGAGFIGSSVVRSLVAHGFRVVVLDNLSTGYQANLDGLDAVRLVAGDIRQSGAVAAALEGSEVVFHLAASVGNVRSIEAPLFDAECNINGTIHLLEAMRRAEISQIIYSSSSAIFGEPDALPIAEGHGCRPDAPYGVSKLAAEQLVLCYGRLYGWTTACLRYFNAYGERQRFDAYGNVIPIFARRIVEGKPLLVYGDGTQTRDFVHVRDIAAANMHAYERRATGAFNIGSGRAIEILELADMIRRAANTDVPIEHAPPRPGEVRHSVADIRRAHEQLEYRPNVELTNGLTEYLHWFRMDFERATTASPQ